MKGNQLPFQKDKLFQQTHWHKEYPQALSSLPNQYEYRVKFHELDVQYEVRVLYLLTRKA